MNDQHPSLHHVFHYNGVKYSELTDLEHKRIIDEMVIALNKRAYGEQIMLYGKDAAFNIIQPTPRNTIFEIDSTLPNDLTCNS